MNRTIIEFGVLGLEFLRERCRFLKGARRLNRKDPSLWKQSRQLIRPGDAEQLLIPRAGSKRSITNSRTGANRIANRVRSVPNTLRMIHEPSSPIITVRTWVLTRV